MPTTVRSEVRACEGFDEYGQIEEVSLVLSVSAPGAPISGFGVFSLFPFLPRSIVLL